MSIIKLPPKLESILNQDEDLTNVVLNNLRPFSTILEGNLYFFPDYTDHSIRHNHEVLKSIEHLIAEDTLETLSPADIGVLATAVALHDIGMHTSPELFKNLIDGEYDEIPESWFKDEKSWKELWLDYLKESHYWDAKKRRDVTGKDDYTIDDESLTQKIHDSLSLDGSDKRFIGEFIRKYHPRLAYEMALKGYIGNTTYNFNEEDLPSDFMQLSGLVARSHGVNVRDAIEILKNNQSDDIWKTPSDIKVVFLMTLIRIADYLQLDASRTSKVKLNLSTIYSPYSLREHERHLAISHIQLGNDDPERIVVQAKPKDAPIYVEIEKIVQDIQKEFDLSWAILGEVYGNEYKLRYRRIVTTISDKKEIKRYKFVPKQFGFKFNNTLPKLLIAPLYGNKPTFGVRELVQNAVDACRTRMALDEEYNNRTDFIHVTVTLDPETAIFRIEDTGIGMNIEEIEKYFLTIGSSYSHSTDWKKTQGDSSMEINRIYRTGRFGIGILAAFLIGRSISVKTKRFKSDQGYEFTLSLDQDFIQINKIDLPDYGTAIEIKCTDNALDSLNEEILERLGKVHSRSNDDSIKWFDWYADQSPRVEYLLGSKFISAITDLFAYYKPLSSKSSKYRDIYWRPYGLIRRNVRPNRELYCNGFLITHHSIKNRFSFCNLEKYLPWFFRLPDLKFTDIYNQLPLNLQRNNIDADAKYGFEMDLLIAMCKDYLCQLLSININYFMKDIECFFLNKDGYTFNHRPDFLINGYENYPYPQKCFQGKTLVHVFYGKKFIYQAWKPFITSHSKAFFTFCGDSYVLHNKLFDFIDRSSINIRGFSLDDTMVYNSLLALNLDSLTDLGYENYLIKRIEGKIRQNSPIISDNYTIVSGNIDLVFANELVAHISSLSVEEKPFLFLIHSIEDDDAPSPLDDFINEYAGGDMIIPYDEKERKRKFAKIYQECGEDIERYRKKYQQLL